ncbi:hypothetical protein K3E94_004879 [Escherichia coli]|nr:hypothetical protein [Escherichia coli]
MAKRKNNVVKKIGDSASLLSKPKSILRRKDFKELVTLTKQNSAPGEWKTEIIEHSGFAPIFPDTCLILPSNSGHAAK